MTMPKIKPPAIALDPERLLGFQPLAAEIRETDPATDWPAALAELHNKVGEFPPGPPAG